MNKPLEPTDVVAGTKRKVWWKCSNNHEWEAAINSRNQGVGCPYCANKAVNKENSLNTMNPQLAKEWHPIKNGQLKPLHVTPNSNKKVWWICDKGHEWETIVANRNRGGGCPYCSGRKVLIEKTIMFTNPLLVKQWHPLKNKDKLDKILPFSNKRVWWVCSNGHEYEARVADRSKGAGCPYCSGRRKHTTKDVHL